MDSLHSGLHDNTDLIVIETEELNFIMKGKPYHDQYESLKKYQSRNIEETMTFRVTGASEDEVRVFSVKENELTDNTEVNPIFFENGTYQIFIEGKANKELAFDHDYPTFRRAIQPLPIKGKGNILTGNLTFTNEVGLSELRVIADGKRILSVTIEVYPVKLDYRKDYQALLKEVNDEIYNLAFHYLKRTFLQAKIKVDGDASQVEFFQLITYYIEHFIKSIKHIERQPHHELLKEYKMVRADRIRKQDSRTRNHLRKNAQYFVPVIQGIEINGESMLPIRGQTIEKVISYNTVENQFVKWMMQRIVDKLVFLKKNIRKEYKGDQLYYEKVGEMERQISNRLNEPFWRKIGRLNKTITSLVMQMAPGYRDAYQIYLTITKGLTLENSMYRMSVKDIAELYEYWTFIKLGQILHDRYISKDQDLIKINHRGLFVKLEPNQRAERTFENSETGEQIKLVYQNTYNNLPTTSQIPDTVLQIEKKGVDYTYHYIFDAKYRINFEGNNGNPGPLEEDINTMHRYRDAIVAKNRIDKYEKISFGAYVLFPWSKEDGYEEHSFFKSIKTMNIGGLPFLPNSTKLVEELLLEIINKSPEDIMNEGILPIGSKLN